MKKSGVWERLVSQVCTGSVKVVGGEPGGQTNSQETIKVVGSEMVLLRTGLLQQTVERES